MGKSLIKAQSRIDPVGGAASLGAGISRPGLSDLVVDLKKVGGFTTKFSGKNNLNVGTSAERKALVGNVSDLLAQGAGELGDIREQVRPGFSAFRKAGLAAIGSRARESIGNLRENLARRRVLGSSFAGDAIQRAEAEFAKEEGEFAAATTLQELDVFTQLTQQITQQQVASVERKIQEMNLELDVGLQLAGAATQSLTAASIQQQQNAQAFTQGIIGLGQAGLFGCAIAREVYGVDNPQWLQFREWLFREAPVWLFRWYMRHQFTVAAWLGDKPKIKRVLRFVMDRIVNG